MKAIVQTRYGSPDDLELREVDPPAVRAAEVLVRVRAASLHPDVWHVVTGRPYVLRAMGAGLFKPTKPIPGTDMAGVVESIGKDVKRFQPGDAVFGQTIGTHQWTNGGAFAEYVSVQRPLRPHLRRARESPACRLAMAVLAELLEAGKVTPMIDSTYPLSEAREAFRHLVEDELRGKVIITTA